ncbi:MAG: hypothetical protein ACP5IB_07105 [Thermoplasmata archaeon]
MDFLNNIKEHLLKRKFIFFGSLIFTFLVLIFFWGILFSTDLLVFPDLGTFPFSKYGLNYYLYSWIPQNFGFYGSALPYQFFIWLSVQIFNNNVLAEHIWLLSLFFIGFFSAYIFLSLSKMDNWVKITFSALYIFNPAVAGLLYTASINDTLTMYVFFPILIYLLIRIYDLNFDLFPIFGFISVFTYVYFWCPQIIMWIFPVLLVLILESLKNFTSKKFLKLILITLLVFITVLLIINGIDPLLKILIGRGNEAFQISAGGTNDVYNIWIDLKANYYGQFSLVYAYLILIWVILVSIFAFYSRNLLEFKEKTILNITQFEIYFILIFWFIFRSNLTFLQILIAHYFPVVGAYEPFFAVTISFSLLILSTGILLGKLKMSRADVKLKKIISIKFPKLISSNKNLFKICITIIIILILLLSPLPYWRQNQTPSMIEMPLVSYEINNLNKVPDNLINMTKWALENTDIDSGYRYLFLPLALNTLAAFQSLFPQNTILNINNTIYNEFFYNFMSTHNTTYLAKYLRILGVEYIFIYKGPYCLRDPNSSYTGSPRLLPAGFPWQLSYLPVGSWNSWYDIFKNSSSFSILINNTGFAVFKNDLYSGIVYAINFNKEIKQNIKIYIKNIVSENPVIGPWEGFDNILGKNFTVKIENNISYVSATNPEASYGNIYAPVYLMPKSSYILTYNISGINMNNSNIFIRFYSGENGTGQVVSTIGSPVFSGNIKNEQINWYFTTPDNFSSAKIFPTVHRNNLNNTSLTNFTIFSLKLLIPLNITKIDYYFKTPTEIKINQSLENGTHLLFISNYNNGWIFKYNNKSIYPIKFNIKILNINLYIINNSIKGSATIYFTYQNDYSLIRNFQMALFFIFLLATISIYIYKKFKGGNKK